MAGVVTSAVVVGQMNAAVKTMMLSGLRKRYPKDPTEIIQRRLADLLLGTELALKAYGPLHSTHSKPKPLAFSCSNLA